jgi:hypothetical protein
LEGVIVDHHALAEAFGAGGADVIEVSTSSMMVRV